MGWDKEKVIPIAILLLLSIILFLLFRELFVIINKLLGIFLPRLICLLVDGAILWRAGFMVCRVCVFPGSWWFIRRAVENDFAKYSSSRNLVTRLGYWAIKPERTSKS